MAEKNNKIRKIIAWVSAVIFFIIIIVPCLLYIPAVQRGVKNIVTSYVNNNTEMKMDVGRVFLKFPLSLDVEDVLILDAQGDTMIYAKSAFADVKFLPLLKLKADIRSVKFQNVLYRMVSEDSSMVLRAQVESFGLRRSDVLLNKNEVNLRNIILKGGKVNIKFETERQQPSPEDTTAVAGWLINLGKITLEDIDYSMQMLPTITSLDTHIGKVQLTDGVVDLATQNVNLKYFGVDSVDVKYIYPTVAYMTEQPVKVDTVTPIAATANWTIRADALRLGNTHVLYAVDSVAEPTDGLDMNYLEVNDVNVAIDSLYNCGSDIQLTLAGLTAHERCGVFVTSGSGFMAMKNNIVTVCDVKLETMQSKLQLDAKVGLDMVENGDAPVDVDLLVNVGVGELGYMYPDMLPILKNIPQHKPVELTLNVDGTAREFSLEKAFFEMPQHINIEADGQVKDVMDEEKLAANVTFSGNFKNLSFMEPMVFTDSTLQSQIDFPEMKLAGTMNYAPNSMRANMDLRLTSGEVVMNAEWNGDAKTYEMNLALDSFPVQAICPLSQLKMIDAKANVSGVGYDPFDAKTSVSATVEVDNISYGENSYRDIRLDAVLAEKNFVAEMLSNNSVCDLNMRVSCYLDEAQYEFGVDGDIANLDLKALKLSSTTSKGKGSIAAYGTADVNTNTYDVDFTLRDFRWSLPDATYKTDDVSVSFVSSQDKILLSAREADMYIDFNADCGMDSLLAGVTRFREVLDYEINEKYLNVDTLQSTLPPFTCEMRVGKKNLVQQLFKSYDLEMRSLNLNMVNDSTIYMYGRALGIESGALKIDTVKILANQRNKYLTYNFQVGNRPGTNDDFAKVSLRGGVRGNVLGMLLEQQNLKGEQGFRVGVNANLSDTAIDVNVFPKQPIIGYRNWRVNDGNVVAYNYINNHFKADLNLRSDSSYVTLRTEPGRDSMGMDDIKLSVGGVQLSEWLKVSPFIPPMSGELNVDMRMKLKGHNILGGGIARLNDFKYNRKKVGDFAFKLGMELDPEKGYVRLGSSFDVNGRKTITARGSLNDTTSVHPYNITLNVDSFPLDVANPFIPGDMAKLGGALNGSLNVVGSLVEPIINGYLNCDDGEINMPLFGSKLTISNTKIPVDSSLIKFDGFKVYGSNKNAINVDGTVNLLPIDNPRINMHLRGMNVEFVNSKQQRKMEVFGKGYANLTASAIGSANDLNTDVSLTLLPTTNLTYVMPTDVAAIATQTDESMVRFVNFADTAEVEEDTIATHVATSVFRLNAKLNIQQGSKFTVFLSNDGNDRVELSGSGVLNYTQSSLGDMRLVGQYTINDGFVRYTPPLLSEKFFEFTPGSYVSFTGDVLNPVLNIKAVDTMKANVSQEGQDSRLVNFLVSLSVTNTLNNMNLEFDLSTNEDMTVQNELLSMSPSQRSSQAINLLLYNTYTGVGTTASTANNPLYSFLNSQINRWAANTIKGVDLTLGVNQYDETRGTATSKSTTYSYKISKSLFNDRFKIVVGGNYNPSGDTDDNFANSLLNDISFVYMLNPSGTMSVKLFRHTGYESILEGEVTETGGAFVIKRKLSSLKNFFRFSRRKRSTAPRQDVGAKKATLPIQQTSKMDEEK